VREPLTGSAEGAGHDGHGSTAPDGLAFRSAAGRWVLAVAVLGSGMAFLDGTVVNVALPDLGRDLHASTAALQWILNGYLLTLASLILLVGSLGDRYGRRRIFVMGVGLFTAASLLCTIAPSSGFLIGARLLQGIGGALLTPGSLAMIDDEVRGIELVGPEDVERKHLRRIHGAWRLLLPVRRLPSDLDGPGFREPLVGHSAA
jgi:MFS family permease